MGALVLGGVINGKVCAWVYGPLCVLDGGGVCWWTDTGVGGSGAECMNVHFVGRCVDC
jgi:hypothetical protein